MADWSIDPQGSNFHVIAGLPRSGSTLLCNVLAQNPRFHVSSTSDLAESLMHERVRVSMSDVTRGALHLQKEATERRLDRVARGTVSAYYAESERPVVFDKGRGWSRMPLELARISPRSTLIVCVRDLRSILASILQQHANMPLLSASADTSIGHVLQTLMSPQGVVGSALVGVQDLIVREKLLPRVHFMPYEFWSTHPEAAFRFLYAALGEEWYAHDFDHVEARPWAVEIDSLWLNKFPHAGTGAVSPADRETWKRALPEAVGSQLIQAYPLYNRRFQYT